ncbi:MAG: hypothetical protein JO320_15470 [Alphaproteobacteria bacterium]|nr:hypothetical protein [Alphaproteobacteria bacterium]MBV9376433.1 hypothetical protein [Alphaproteobacteria bacterium]
MDPSHFGSEQVTDEDRSYRGSRFAEVRDALFANPYQKVWGASGEPPLPVYDVTLPNVLRGVLRAALPFGPPYFFRQAVARAVDSKADLRWGADRKGFRRIIHPNGICLIGLWQISEENPYSGYFRAGSRALSVARYSTCCKETRRGRQRSLSLVGKLFPTADPGHAAPLRTASFITQQDLGGERTEYINDVELRNAPNTTSWRRGFGVPILLVESILFNRIDKQPTQRQLYQIAELGKPDGEATRAPAFMRLLVDPAQPRIPGDALDFRDEIMAQIYDRGDPVAKRALAFNIETTDEGSTHGPAFFERRSFGTWRRIGRLVFNEAVASYNGDFVIHFNHPTWRDDRNDPSTATRVGERKVR